MFHKAIKAVVRRVCIYEIYLSQFSTLFCIFTQVLKSL